MQTKMRNPEKIKNLQVAIDFCLEKNRRKTFKTWVFPDDANASAVKLAEAGFIFIGNKQEPDAVKCFLCDKQLENWDEDDDPWVEHLKHAPKCSFAELGKPETVFTLPEFADIRNELIEKLLRDIFKQEKEYIDDVLNDCVSMITVLK